MRSDNKTLFGVPFDVRQSSITGKPEQFYQALHEVSLSDAHAEGKILKRVATHAIDYKVQFENTLTNERLELSLSELADIGQQKNDIDAFIHRKKLRFHPVYLERLLSPAFREFFKKRERLSGKIRNNELKTGRTHQMLVIAMSNAHAAAMLEFIRERFPQFRSARIGQDIPKQERDTLLQDYRNGNIDVMVQVDMIGEGTDIKPISVIVKADLVRAFSKTLQQIFRGMRYFHDFDEEENLCDIYASNDSGIIKILEWLMSEEKIGVAVKVQREEEEQQEKRERKVTPKQESLWQVAEVEEQVTHTHMLELFPGMTRPTLQKKRSKKNSKSTSLEASKNGTQDSMSSVVDVSVKERELRQECSNLAARLTHIFRSSGQHSEIKRIHGESKRRFIKPQEEMSLPELE
jgi:superfamily II DNA or RNA helicase